MRSAGVVLTDPRSFATRIADTALPTMPSRSTNASCRSRKPSRCAAHAKPGDGGSLVKLVLSQLS